MAKCLYCGKSAGILREFHRDCKERHEAEVARVSTTLTSMLISNEKTTESRHAPLEVELHSEILSPQEIRGLAIHAWETAVSRFLEDGLLTRHEEEGLLGFAKAFLLEQADLDSHGWYARTAIAGMLRDISEQKIPQRLTVDGTLPFNLKKNESLVHLFPETHYFEYKTKRHYQGGHHGASIRIARGLYYRIGAFKGQPVDTTYCHHWGSGLLALTTKNIYFHSATKAVRLPYAKIVSFDAFDNGIGVMRDNKTAKPEYFVTGDGWAVYNLAVNLARVFG